MYRGAEIEKIVIVFSIGYRLSHGNLLVTFFSLLLLKGLLVGDAEPCWIQYLDTMCILKSWPQFWVQRDPDSNAHIPIHP